GSVRGSRSESAECLLDREPLVGEPAAGRLTLEVSARDGGKEAESGITELDGKVAAEGQVNPGVEETAPGVGPSEAASANALLCPGHVARGMGRLHRGDDTELREPRDVGDVDDLRVLDAEAGGGGDTGAGVGLEDVVVGRVANGVGGDLESSGERATGD